MADEEKGPPPPVAPALAPSESLLQYLAIGSLSNIRQAVLLAFLSPSAREAHCLLMLRACVCPLPSAVSSLFLFSPCSRASLPPCRSSRDEQRRHPVAREASPGGAQLRTQG
jgi:hypothetical protein